MITALRPRPPPDPSDSKAGIFGDQEGAAFWAFHCDGRPVSSGSLSDRSDKAAIDDLSAVAIGYTAAIQELSATAVGRQNEAAASTASDEDNHDVRVFEVPDNDEGNDAAYLRGLPGDGRGGGDEAGCFPGPSDDERTPVPRSSKSCQQSLSLTWKRKTKELQCSRVPR